MALKVGVVGMSEIGNNHANCHANDDLAELVAVCDIMKERANTAAERLGVKAYYNLADMIDGEPDLDIVDVGTGGYENGSWHYEPTMEALDKGKHVLVEKPLSNDIGQAREMVAKATEEDLYLGCNLNHYLTPPAEQAKKYIEDGHIGEMTYCLHKMGFPGGEFGYSYSKAPRSDGFPYFHVKAFLAHPFSVMRHFCGDVTHVQAFMKRPHFRRGAGDVMVSINSIHLRFENGCIGYLLSHRRDVTFGLGGWWSVELAGTRGTFCIENCLEKVTYWSSPGAPDFSDEPIVTESGISDFDQTFPLRIHAFLEDITNGVPKEQLRASGRDALATLEYTWAAIESYEQGGIVVRPQPLPPLKG